MPNRILGPALSVIAGSMFSGKSEELIRRIRVLQYSGLRVLVVKPSIDTRTESFISSRNGANIPAIVITHAREIIALAADHEVVVIDEGQFVDPDQPKELSLVAMILVRMGKYVIVAGLPSDFKEDPFENMAFTMALAEDIQIVSGTCHRCKEHTASRSNRKSASRTRVEVGDSDYEALCLYCYEPPEKSNGTDHTVEVSSVEPLPS